VPASDDEPQFASAGAAGDAGFERLYARHELTRLYPAPLAADDVAAAVYDGLRGRGVAHRNAGLTAPRAGVVLLADGVPVPGRPSPDGGTPLRVVRADGQAARTGRGHRPRRDLMALGGIRSTVEEREQRRAAERELAERAVEELRTSAGWQRWLGVRRHFHRCGLRNQLLISMQSPGATHVAGFRAWLDLGYAVRKARKRFASGCRSLVGRVGVR
jgi:hypothetical protein